VKQQTCKFILEDGTRCSSMFHTAMWHKPKKPIKVNKKTISVDVQKKKSTKKNVKSRSYYVKQLDMVFSQYIRQKDAVNGYATCVTCGALKPWQEQQNGHYMSRGHLLTRWSEDNCAVQCVACNVFKKGNYTEYSLWMINTYGAEKLTELKERANSGEKIPTYVIKEKIEEYKALLK